MKTLRTIAMFALLATTGPGLHGQQRPAAGANMPAGVVGEVTVAIGRGRVDQARAAIAAAKPDEQREFATALVELFEGRHDDARRRLETLVQARRGGPEAILELGLLQMRTGRRGDGERLLAPIVANRTLNSVDDYFLLARAAVPVGEYLLANDAYQRIADVARPDVQTEWGDLFLSKHAYGEAVKSYQLALEADQHWIRAHLGMARALLEQNPPAATAALEAARKIAPNHPDVWLLAAERHLVEDDLAAATAALDRVAAVRANDVEEAALRGAIAHIEGRTAEMNDALARVQALDAMSARGYRALGEAAALKYRFDDAVGFATKATEIDVEDQRAHADLGLYLLRTGDEAKARVELERAFALDRSDTVTYNLLTMLDALEKFTVVEHGPFIFKFPPEEAAALGAYALPLATEAYETFQKRYGFTPKGPLLIEIFAKHDDFAVRTVGLMGLEGALGACFGRVVSMDSPRARPPGDFSWQATLWHELAHVFSLQLSDYRVPRWLTEGISVFEEHRRQPAWGRELTLEYAHAMTRGRTFGVKDLPRAFKRIESLAMAYFEASLVVEHLVELNGDAGLQALLKAYADRATDAEAFARAFKRSVDDVEASFRKFTEARYGALAKALAEPSGKPDPGNLAALRDLGTRHPDNFIVQNALGQSLFKQGQLAEARAALVRAATLAPQASGATSPRALLAQISRQEGDPDGQRRELRALLQWDHTNIVAARELAGLAAAANATEDEDFALRLVADLDPFDPTAHAALGRRLMTKGQYADAIIEFKAAVAVNPPNLAEAHADVAEASLKAGQWQDARHHAFLALKLAPNFARAQDLYLAAGKGK